VRRVSRRRFLAGAVALAGGAAASACAREPGSKVVRFSNWPFYIDRKALPDFRRRTGIRVDYIEDINDNEEYFAKIREPLSRGRGIDRDLIVLTDSTAAQLVRLGWVSQLDRAAIPNAAQLIPDLRGAAFDPERSFTLPWVAGITGIAYNSARTGRDLTRVADLLDPALAGHVTMLTDMEDTLGLLMLGAGADPATATASDFDEAVIRLRNARDRGQIRRFTGDDYGPDLVRGDVWAAIAWSGDVVQLQRENKDLRFVVPEEGGLIWSDEMMIPRGTRNKAGAEALMNFMYDPQVSARLIAEVQFISPVAGAIDELRRIDPELASSPLIDPPDATRSRLHSFRALDDEERRRFRGAFQDVVRG
jgi:spermidine/putrescine transport system substrate-binding protein